MYKKYVVMYCNSNTCLDNEYSFFDNFRCFDNLDDVYKFIKKSKIVQRYFCVYSFVDFIDRSFLNED